MVPNSQCTRRGGFFTSLVRGVFGLLTTGVICGSALGLYGLHIVDKKGDRVLTAVDSFVRNFPEWQRGLPPVLSDAVSDRRDPSYSKNLEVTARAKVDSTSGRGRVIVEVQNNGDKTVSLLSLRAVALDAEGDPLREFAFFGATPLPSEGQDWRGPLPPGGHRVLVEDFNCRRESISARVDVGEIRVWDPEIARQREADARARSETTSDEVDEPVEKTAPEQNLP